MFKATLKHDSRPGRHPRLNLQTPSLTDAELEQWLALVPEAGRYRAGANASAVKLIVSGRQKVEDVAARLGITLPEPGDIAPTPAIESDIHPFERPERPERPSGTHKRKARKGKGEKKGPNRAEVTVLRALRSLGWIVRRGGVIDFVARRDERVAWVEVKNRDSGDTLDKGQKVVLRALRHAGLEEYVVDVWPSTGRVRVWTIPGETPVPFGEVFGV